MMMNACERLCRLSAPLPVYSYPFPSIALPRNGIILMYEQGQFWGHGGDEPRIVHIGTHRDGNLASRLAEHFSFDSEKMDVGEHGVSPKDRSILRKTIGRALLYKDRDPYLALWNIDFTTRANRDRYSSSRDLEKEKKIEVAVTAHLRSHFSCRIIPVVEEDDRMGKDSVTRRIIASVAQCDCCCPTPDWLGNHATDERICRFGLWQVQHTRGDVLCADDFQLLDLWQSHLYRRER